MVLSRGVWGAGEGAAAAAAAPGRESARGRTLRGAGAGTMAEAEAAAGASTSMAEPAAAARARDILGKHSAAARGTVEGAELDNRGVCVFVCARYGTCRARIVFRARV